jgi:hypothetical protein
MAVYRLFQDRAFEPEAVSIMTRTYSEVCGALGISVRDGRQADVVARTVIEFAQRGARDPGLLRDCVLQALRERSHESHLA